MPCKGFRKAYFIPSLERHTACTLSGVDVVFHFHFSEANVCLCMQCTPRRRGKRSQFSPHQVTVSMATFCHVRQESTQAVVDTALLSCHLSNENLIVYFQPPVEFGSHWFVRTIMRLMSNRNWCAMERTWHNQPEASKHIVVYHWHFTADVEVWQ